MQKRIRLVRLLKQGQQQGQPTSAASLVMLWMKTSPSAPDARRVKGPMGC